MVFRRGFTKKKGGKGSYYTYNIITSMRLNSFQKHSTMEGHMDDNMLRNCTAMVLSLEFDHSSKELEHYNSTELLALLGTMLQSADLTMSKRTIAKDRLHDCVYPLPEPSHNISLWHKLIWSTVFIPMLIVAIIGNSIVIWIVAGM